MTIIAVTDLPASLQTAELVETMVEAANAKAARVAPCLSIASEPLPTFDQLAEAKLVLIGAVKRWVESGSGAFTQQTAGPFSVSTDTRQRSGYNLWPSEITTLQEICKTDSDGREAFSLDTVGSSSLAMHDVACSLRFGATYCSCGADIAGEPIYGLG